MLTLVQAIESLRTKLLAPGTRSISLPRSTGRVLLDALTVAPPAPAPASVTAVPVTGEPVFEDVFDFLDLNRWATVPLVNDPAGNGSSLPGNEEKQWYLNHAFVPTAAWKPWLVENGELVIRAFPTPDAIRQYLGYGPGNNPQLAPQFGPAWFDYVSGRLATHNSFSQLYGYFEAEMKCPAGKGLWPAFWLLPKDMSWPPEIDVLEVLGHEPGRAYQTLHWEDGSHKSDHAEAFIDTTEWHRYGVLWTRETVTFYVDGRVTKSFPTPAGMHRPMYMILNLAVGGSWPGYPDASTQFPAELRVRSVRAWRV